MKLEWRWQAVFYNDKLDGDDAVFITQPEDDRYSKHDDNADWNPSAYRDFLDYFNEHKEELKEFRLFNKNGPAVVVDFHDRKHPFIRGEARMFDRVEDSQPIYYRKMENTVVNGRFGEPRVRAYVVGFQGKVNGKNVQQTVEVV